MLVVGTGTIGEPLIGLLADFKTYLGIDTLYFYKNSARLTDRPLVKDLQRRGAVLVSAREKVDKFRELELEPVTTFEEALTEADVVIDCTPKGVGMENKRRYYERHAGDTIGFMAQGSESEFGPIYVSGVNDRIFEDKSLKFVQIASCNTHNMAVVIHSLGFKEGRLNLKRGDFVLMRRANDVSQVANYVPAPKVSPYTSDRFGTHHAHDINRLFKTLGYDLDVFSSAVVIPTQYMHTLNFHLSLKEPTTLEEVIETLKAEPHFAVTYKTAQNLVFSFGRDHGFYGRLLTQAVAVIPSLFVKDGTEVYGTNFTPQDGNSLLSSVKAMSYFFSRKTGEEPVDVMKIFARHIYHEV